MIGTYSSGIRQLRLLPSVLKSTIQQVQISKSSLPYKEIIGWGLKDNTKKAQQYADRRNLPYLRLEDGFIRSIGLGVKGAEPFGFIIDRTGIYYDASRPSDVEKLIVNYGSKNCDRAARLIERIVSLEVSKYNHIWSGVELDDDNRPKVLLIDQTFGDLSVKYGLADEHSFEQMLEVAMSRYPDGRFYVKTHPDVIAGKKKGYLTHKLPAGVRVIDKDCNPIALLKQVDHVFTVTSQMGFEALMAGKPVTCFGMPFYAGWGITEDFVKCERRAIKRSLSQVFAAAYLDYVRYADPATGQCCELERILDLIGSHKKQVSKNTGSIYCFGFRFWKRVSIKRFLESRDTRIYFVRNAKHAAKLGIDRNSRMVVWGIKDSTDVRALANKLGIDLERIEDGFIRSVGLGSDFARPSSLIVDRRGIYFDPNQPSDLENLLNTVNLDDAAISRAKRLRSRIVDGGISKYNVSHGKTPSIRPGDKRRVILVPGQVEDDASIQRGCVDVCTNLELLEAVRKAEPEAYIIFKPHPDVLAGNRKGDVPENIARKYCDQVVTDCNISVCLDQADQVHTMTSLTGFEALMRKKTVYTYGLPFYAGWGLTQDRHRLKRRQRKLSLDDLVYCALIAYPRYFSWSAFCFAQVEDIINSIQSNLSEKKGSVLPFFMERWWRKFLYLIEGFREN
ncbi:MAG: capsular polysaccharide biosynthesis protein [Desulfobacteraceae bacterium]|nr:capsular polysaccharide biosynthesis protein [Desulfobacteraceae bacterium]